MGEPDGKPNQQTADAGTANANAYGTDGKPMNRSANAGTANANADGTGWQANERSANAGTANANADGTGWQANELDSRCRDGQCQCRWEPDGKPMNGRPMPGRPMPMQMGPDGKPIVPPIPNRPASSMPEKKPEAAPVPPMPEKKPEAAPVPPMPEKKPEAAPVPPMPEKKPEAAPVPPVEEKKPQVPVPYLLRIATNEKIYINKPEFSIGRSATKADYTVTDNSDVSRIHCIIAEQRMVVQLCSVHSQMYHLWKHYL